MSLRSQSTPTLGSIRPLATAVGLLVCVHVWWRVATVIQRPLLAAIPGDGLLVGSLVGGALLVGGLAAFAGWYARRRGVDVGLSLPVGEWRALGVAAAAPPALVGLSKLVGSVTGVPYNALTKSAYAADASPVAVLALLGPGLIVGALSLTVVCQVLLQGTFSRAVGDAGAAVATTALAAFALSSSVGGLTAVPDRGKLLGAVAFVLALGLALYAGDRVADRRLRALAAVPAAGVVALVVASWIAATGSIAELLFGVAHVSTLALAAVGYARTDSLVVPAVAYLSLLLANEGVVLLFEAGTQHW